jgi:methylated-DNA-[protein]-cysteine S-methyltransferase
MTPFAQKVYKIVLKIPLGEVRTYKWVAKKAGQPKAVRSVGQILKHNPYPILIPCHRVVGSNGKIGGYIWGKNFKRRILDLESKLKELMI